MNGVAVSLLIRHGFVAEADCTTGVMMPTTEWCDGLIFSYYVPAFLYAPFLCRLVNPMRICIACPCHSTHLTGSLIDGEHHFLMMLMRITGDWLI